MSDFDLRDLQLAQLISGKAYPSRRLLEVILATCPGQPTPGFAWGNEMQALHAILRRGKALREDRSRLRAIGLLLHRAGGLAAMQAVACELRRLYPMGEGGDEDGWHPGQLDAAWNRVGDWRW